MTIWNIIAICILLCAVASIIGIGVYKMRKNGRTISFDEFMTIYSDQIIEVLKDVVVLLQVNIDEFETKDDYERVIISTTIDKLKENSKELGIDICIFDIFSTEDLSEMIYKIFQGNLLNIFSVASTEKISEKPELYENEVVKAYIEE